MNTLSQHLNNHDTYPIPHADYLRLLHAHTVGVTVLDMFDSVNCLSARLRAGRRGACLGRRPAHRPAR